MVQPALPLIPTRAEIGEALERQAALTWGEPGGPSRAACAAGVGSGRGHRLFHGFTSQWDLGPGVSVSLHPSGSSACVDIGFASNIPAALCQIWVTTA